MKKQKTFAMLFLALLVFWNVCQALIIPPTGEGQIGLEAVVLCEKLTIRQEPRSNSKAVQTLPYGFVFPAERRYYFAHSERYQRLAYRQSAGCYGLDS